MHVGADTAWVRVGVYTASSAWGSIGMIKNQCFQNFLFPVRRCGDNLMVILLSRILSIIVSTSISLCEQFVTKNLNVNVY